MFFKESDFPNKNDFAVANHVIYVVLRGIFVHGIVMAIFVIGIFLFIAPFVIEPFFPWGIISLPFSWIASFAFIYMFIVGMNVVTRKWPLIGSPEEED